MTRLNMQLSALSLPRGSLLHENTVGAATGRGGKVGGRVHSQLAAQGARVPFVSPENERSDSSSSEFSMQ